MTSQINSQPEEVECTKDLINHAHTLFPSVAWPRVNPFLTPNVCLLKIRVEKKDGICPSSESSRHGDAEGKARKTLGFLTGLIRYVHQGEKLGKPQDEGSQPLMDSNKTQPPAIPDPVSNLHIQGSCPSQRELSRVHLNKLNGIKTKGTECCSDL